MRFGLKAPSAAIKEHPHVSDTHATRMAHPVGGRRGQLFDVRLARPIGRRRGGQPPAAALVHPVVDERRAKPARHLRPEAGPCQRRPLPRHPDLDSRHPDQRAFAAYRPFGRAPCHHSLDEQPRGGPRPGDLPDAHRLCPRRSGAISDARLVVFARAGAAERRIAELREHRAVSILQPGGVQPRLPRATACAAGAGRRSASAAPRSGPGAAARQLRGFAAGARSRCAGRGHAPARGRARAVARLDGPRFRRVAAGAARAEPPRR